MTLNRKISIIWLNVNGIEKGGSLGSGLGALLDIFKQSPYDIICIQETHYNVNNYPQPNYYENICTLRGYHAYFTHSGEGTEGVAVICKNHIPINNIGVVEVFPNRCQLVQLVTEHGTLTFANSYAPSNNNNKARSNYFISLAKLLPCGCVVGGDFNVVQDLDLDLIRPNAKSPYDNKGWDKFIELQGALQIEDRWRYQEGEEARAFTKRTISHGIMTCQSRIDMVLIPKDNCPVHFPWITQLGHDLVFWQGQDQHTNQARADHVGVTLELSICENSEGDTRRKAIKGITFNSKLWHETINQHWNTHLAQWDPNTPITEWWEQWKVQAYDQSIKVEASANKKIHQARDSLHIHMQLVADNVVEKPTSKGATNMLKQAQKRVHEWENLQLLIKKRQRIAYGVNIAEQLHPGFLN